MGDQTNNPMLIALAFYSVVLIFVVLPSFAIQKQQEINYNNELAINASKAYLSEQNLSSTDVFSKVSRPIGFFESLWLLLIDDIPFWANIVFIVLPNVYLAAIIFDKIRG